MISSKCWVFSGEDNVSHYLIQCFNNSNSNNKKKNNKMHIVLRKCAIFIEWCLKTECFHFLIRFFCLCLWIAFGWVWMRQKAISHCLYGFSSVTFCLLHDEMIQSLKSLVFLNLNMLAAWNEMQRWCQFHICIRNYHSSYKHILENWFNNDVLQSSSTMYTYIYIWLWFLYAIKKNMICFYQLVCEWNVF